MYSVSTNIHDFQFNNNKLIINPEYFNTIKLGDVVEIFNSNNEKILELDVESVEKVKGISLLSIRLDMARLANISPRQHLKINILTK